MKKMFKTIGVLVFFVLVASGAFATISMLKPYDKALEDGSTLNLGETAKLSQGETLELIFSVDSKEGFNWNQAYVEESTLPANWSQEKSIIYGEQIGLKMKIAGDALDGTQRLKIILASDSKTESFDLILFIKKGLLSANIQGLDRAVKVGDTVAYNVTIGNDSIADHTVIISSDLPSYWMKEKEVTVKGKEFVKTTFTVVPKTYGERKFNFILKSKLNDSSINSFEAILRVQPTIESKFFNALYGFPFFSPTLTPYYLINSFLALITKSV
ncbi:MAG: hypothetical protein AB1467_00415 [Candidatus Diapherotrites archaeon]